MKLPASEQNHNQLASIVRKLLLENKVPPKDLFSKEKHRKNRIQASARASNEWNLNYSQSPKCKRIREIQPVSFELIHYRKVQQKEGGMDVLHGSRSISVTAFQAFEFDSKKFFDIIR